MESTGRRKMFLTRDKEKWNFMKWGKQEQKEQPVRSAKNDFRRKKYAESLGAFADSAASYNLDLYSGVRRETSKAGWYDTPTMFNSSWGPRAPFTDILVAKDPLALSNTLRSKAARRYKTLFGFSNKKKPVDQLNSPQLEREQLREFEKRWSCWE
eukprot:TRINITY_DN28934_c0_g1_i1.p1 TRINITY_DN28934_c0_g1~~TRINITY_DN28934_c0_g1_i1.p1  ORF type:complete len:179 (+),score=56.42 TRINITY_DN28934_c0_g1_i1:73-537(+)